jgi:hypothetical protein
MSTGWWFVIFVVGWIVVSAVTAPLVGKWLRHNSQYYPEPPPDRPSPPNGPCVEEAPRD